MKIGVFAILFVFCVSNAFASNWWIFSIPGVRKLPIQLLNLSPTSRRIKMIQLFRRDSGQVYEAHLAYENSQPSELFERYTQPNLETQALDSLDALAWIRFWNSVHEKSPLTIEAVRTLNTLYKVELIIHDLRSEQELD